MAPMQRLRQYSNRIMGHMVFMEDGNNEQELPMLLTSQRLTNLESKGCHETIMTGPSVGIEMNE